MANSRTVGKALKSSGLVAFSAAISTPMDSAMLKTKNTSSITVGMGSTIMAISARMPAGSASDAALTGSFARDFAERGWLVASFFTQALATAVAIALPVTLVLLLVQLVTGVIGRSAPSLNLFALGLPASVLAGLAALIASTALLGEQFVMLAEMAIEQAGMVVTP